jgi:hypothetical protein
MDKLKKMRVFINKKVIFTALILGILVFSFGTYQVLYLRKAHSTFENYYAFRGCVQIIERKDDYGICKTDSGQNIKIVKYQGKWYLDGDLPWACMGKICFGL